LLVSLFAFADRRVHIDDNKFEPVIESVTDFTTDFLTIKIYNNAIFISAITVKFV